MRTFALLNNSSMRGARTINGRIAVFAATVRRHETIKRLALLLCVLCVAVVVQIFAEPHVSFIDFKYSLSLNGQTRFATA